LEEEDVRAPLGEPGVHAARERGPDAVDVDGRDRERPAAHAAGTACSAASTTLARSIARVIGPTPPGFGESQAATSATPSATSPRRLALPVSGSTTRETPTSSTIAPGRTMSAVTIPGTPAAATTTSACRTREARSRVPVWVRVTVALTARRVRSRPMLRPTVVPRPITTTGAPSS